MLFWYLKLYCFCFFNIVKFIVMTIPFSSQHQVALHIEVSGLPNNQGKVALELYNEQQEIVAQRWGDISDKKSFFEFNDLPQGRYAVRLFHDANNNQKLDTNWFGMPIEAYGFSNDARALTSAPAFEKQLFDLFEAKSIKITAR